MFVNKLVKDRIMLDKNSGGMDKSLHLKSVLALHHTHTVVLHLSQLHTMHPYQSRFDRRVVLYICILTSKTYNFPKM